MSQTLPELAREWESFYLLTGTAGATLAGLLFVASSLAPRLMMGQDMNDVRVFTDPSLLAFTSSLVLSGLLLIPTLQAPPLGIALLLLGLLLPLYLAGTLRRLWRFSRQDDAFDLSDWLWHIASPVATNLLILAVGILFLLGRAALGLDALAFTVLLLLVTGIRNAWDLMVWVVSHGGEG